MLKGFFNALGNTVERFVADGRRKFEFNLRMTQDGEDVARAYRTSLKQSGVKGGIALVQNHKEDGSDWDRVISVKAEGLTLEKIDEIRGNIANILGDDYQQKMKSSFSSGTFTFMDDKQLGI